MSPEAAVAIVRAREPEDSVLLMRRTVREGDSWSGQWSFPGGRADPGDPAPLFTALRELREECGVDLPESALQTALPERLARRHSPPFLTVAPFVFTVDRQADTVLCPEETAEALWIPVDTLRDRSRHRLQIIPGMASAIRFPGIDLKGLPLWGFTYRLITDWLDLGPPVRPIERAGREAAGTVLSYLLTRGLTLESDWHPGAGSSLIAGVSGPIPAADVLDYFSQPGDHVAAINRMVARPESVSLLGPAFEEYVIASTG